MADPNFTCPAGQTVNRPGAGGAAAPLPNVVGLPNDILEIIVTVLLYGFQQNIRYILTDNEGVKFYSDYKATNPGTGKASNNWFALSLGAPTLIVAPPKLFTQSDILSKTVSMSKLNNVLTKNQIQIAESLSGISRLTYAQEFIGIPVTKSIVLDNLVDIEFQFRSASSGEPIIEFGQVYAKVNYQSSGGISKNDFILDDFERPTVNNTSTNSGYGKIRRTFATVDGSDAEFGGLFYTSLEYNYYDDTFITINTQGYDDIVKINVNGFFVMDSLFSVGGLQRDNIAMSPVENYIFIAEGQTGSIYAMDLFQTYPKKELIKSGLNINAPNAVFPVIECSKDGKIIINFGTTWYQVSRDGLVVNMGTAGSGNCLTRVDDSFYISNGVNIDKLDISNVPGTNILSVNNNLIVEHILSDNIFGLIVNKDFSFFYAIQQNVQSEMNPAGTIIIKINRITKAVTPVFSAPSGYYIYGIAFGKSSLNPADPALYALIGNNIGINKGVAVTYKLVEVIEEGSEEFVLDPNDLGSAPDGWSIVGTGGALVGTLGNNKDVLASSRIILSKIPPGNGCQMFYKQVQWYERGWRINACCGVWIEFNGVQWLIVKRSIDIDTTCGGGESETTACIQQYIESGQGHPAIAWPTIDGEEFLGLPNDGFVNFIKDDVLSAALLNKLAAQQYFKIKGDPIANIPFILFPAS